MLHPARRTGWFAYLLVLTLIGTIVLSFPLTVSADTDLDVGGEARVSYTGGDSIRVRSRAVVQQQCCGVGAGRLAGVGSQWTGQRRRWVAVVSSRCPRTNRLYGF